jgi:hypothetical protein
MAAPDGPPAPVDLGPQLRPDNPRLVANGLLKPLTRSWSINEQQRHRRASGSTENSVVASRVLRVWGAICQYGSGLRSALGFGSLDAFVALVSFFKLRRVRTRIWQCLLVNGFIFIGSLLWLHVVVVPLLRLLLAVGNTNEIISTSNRRCTAHIHARI